MPGLGSPPVGELEGVSTHDPHIRHYKRTLPNDLCEDKAQVGSDSKRRHP